MNVLVIVIFALLAVVSSIVILLRLPMAVQDTPQARIKRRLTTIGRLDSASRAEIQSILKTSVYSEVPWVNEILARAKFVHTIDLMLERGNLDMTPGMFLLCSLGASAVTFLLASIIGQPSSVSIVFAIVALFCPFVYLQFIIWKRLRKFLEQFPDGLDMISQSLQAGLGLTQAMVFVAREMPDPLGTEFSVFIEEINLGLPLPEGLKKFEERMNLPEVRLFNTALLVQREVGGSLAELLTKLSNIIRDRFRIERLIKSLTAQNRISAWTVCSVPPFLAFFMFLREPEMMNRMMQHPVGRGMLAAALVLEIVGILVFRKIIKINI